MIDIEVDGDRVMISGTITNVYSKDVFLKKYEIFQQQKINKLGYFENDELLMKFFEQDVDLVLQKYPEELF